MIGGDKAPRFETHQNWYHLSSIQIAGGTWGLLTMGVGVSLYLRFGLLYSLLSVIIGNLIILLGYYYVVKMTVANRLNAIQNVERFVGKIPAKFFAFLVLITMIGWLALNLERLGQGLEQLSFGFEGVNIQVLVGCSASIVLLFGIRGLRILSLLIVPVMLILLVVAFFIVGSDFGYAIKEYSSSAPFSLLGILPVLIVQLDTVFEYPTFYQHSRSFRDSLISLLVVFIATCVGQYIIIYIGGGSKESITSFIGPEMYDHTILNVVSSSFLIIGTLGVSAWNIYAASVGWESLLPMLKGRVEYAVIGLSAIVLLGSLPVKTMLTHIVSFGAIPIVCIVVNMIINFIMIGKKIHKINKLVDKHGMPHQHSYERVPREMIVLNNVAWVIGSVAGVFAKLDIWMHGVDPLIISSIASGGATFVFLILLEILDRSSIHS